MKAVHIIAFILLIIGGLNWGLVGLGMWFGSDWNVVHLIFGSIMWLEALIYVLVGLSALWIAFTHKSACKMCADMGTKKAAAPAAPSSGSQM
jgi:uncharacterized membrane protein YuzA (DUF378 family)